MKVFLIGFMGSGKTYWGKKWAELSGLQFFDIDDMVEVEQGKSAAEIFAEDGEDFFREQESMTLRKFSQKDDFIVACGGGTPCYDDNISWMNKNGTTVYLQSSPENILERLTAETIKRPLIRNLRGGELLFYITGKIQERDFFYKQAGTIVNVDELSDSHLPDIFNL